MSNSSSTSPPAGHYHNDGLSTQFDKVKLLLLNLENIPRTLVVEVNDDPGDELTYERCGIV